MADTESARDSVQNEWLKGVPIIDIQTSSRVLTILKTSAKNSTGLSG